MRTWSPWPLASTILLVAYVTQRAAVWSWDAGTTPWLLCGAAIGAALGATYAAYRDAPLAAVLGPLVLSIAGLAAEVMQGQPAPDPFSDDSPSFQWALTLALVGTLSISTAWALRGQVTGNALTRRAQGTRALALLAIVAAAAASVAGQEERGSMFGTVVLVIGASLAWSLATTNVEPRAELRVVVAVSLAMIGTFVLVQGIEVEQYLVGNLPTTLPIPCWGAPDLSAAIVDERWVMGCTLAALIPSLAVTVKRALRTRERLLFAAGAALAAMLFACTSVRASFDGYLAPTLRGLYAPFARGSDFQPVRVSRVSTDHLVCPRSDTAWVETLVVTPTEVRLAARLMRHRSWDEHGDHSAEVLVIRADRRVTLGRALEAFERYGPRPGVLALAFAVPGPFDSELAWSTLLPEVEATVSIAHRQGSPRDGVVVFRDEQSVEEVIAYALAHDGERFATSHLPD